MDQAFIWINELSAWRMSYSDFLREMTIDEFGNKRSTHERLLKAESSLWRLIRQQTLFTFLECIDITVPTTNNRIEGGVNAQLRSMLRAHRGLSLEKKIKSGLLVVLYALTKTAFYSDILNCMPTDESIAAIYKRLSSYCQIDRSIPQWGDAPVWNELHMSTDFSNLLGLVTHFLSYNPQKRFNAYVLNLFYSYQLLHYSLLVLNVLSLPTFYYSDVFP